jgi:hypothetical protein
MAVRTDLIHLLQAAEMLKRKRFRMRAPDGKRRFLTIISRAAFENRPVRRHPPFGAAGHDKADRVRLASRQETAEQRIHR